MKIEGNVNYELSIYDLDEGDVFAVYDPIDEIYDIYMKTDSTDNECKGIKVNAVNLRNGQLRWFDEDEKIYRVSGKFVIGG